MNATIPIALLGWVAASLLFFATLPPRRAAIVCVVGGALFLPIAGFQFPGLPDFTKQASVAVGVVSGIVCFDSARLATLRLRWFDLPVLVLTALPFATSISNGLGPHDGLSSVYTESLHWLIPYFVGRLYFTRAEHLRELALGLVVGALVYVPLCLIEVRLSPQLHTWVYGYHQHTFGQSKRYGGYRPVVFLNHGLSVAAWMAFASLAALWLWIGRATRTMGGLPTWAAVPLLLVMVVLCKSVGPGVLLGLGIAVIALAYVGLGRLALGLLLAFPVVYTTMRTLGWWSFATAVDWSSTIAGEDRAGSLDIRLQSENILIGRALERPFLGWGGWNRNRPEDQKNLLTDGLWVIVFSQGGISRLVAHFLTLLLPGALLVARLSPKRWLRGAESGGTAMVVVVALLAIENLFNAGVNPFYAMTVGAVTGWAGSLRESAGAPGRTPQIRSPVAPRRTGVAERRRTDRVGSGP